MENASNFGGDFVGDSSSGSGESGGEANDFSRKLSDSHFRQISVLRTMNLSDTKSQQNNKEPKQYQINEIASLSGVADEKEVQRYLFILEGQKMVAPFPAGDFTSKTWHITKLGVRALRTIQSTTTS